MAVIMVLSMLPMSVFATEPAALEVVSQQLNLSDDLTMRFYVKADSNTVVNATVAGVTNAYDLSTMTADENGQYVVPVSLAAAQMAEEITLDFLQNGENVLQKTYTIRDYAVTILEGNYPARTKKMVRHMLHYGAKAQQYFDVNTGSLVNVGYEITEEAALPSEYEAMSVSGSVSGLRFYGASLVFENKIAVRYYFTGSVEGVDFGDYDAISKGDMYYVEVPGINPQDYAKNITLTATKGEETLAVSYSPLNYIIRMSEKGNDELKALLNALYGYHTAAIEYVKNKEQEGMFFGSAGSFVSSPVIDLSTDCGEMPYLVLDAHKSTPLYTYIANLNTQNFSFETTVKVDSVIENENYPKLGMLVNGQTEMVKFYLDMNPELQVPQVGAVHQNTGKDDDWAYTSVTTLSEALDLSTNTVMLKLVRDGVNYYFYVNGAMVLAGNDLTDENGAVGFFSFGTELTLTDYTVAAAGADYEQALTQAKADAEAFNQVRNQILQTSTSYTVEELKLGAKLWNGRGFVFTELPEALIGQSYVYGKFNTQIDMTVLQDGYLYVLTPPTNHANFPDNILSEGSGFAQLSIAEDWCLANYSNPINTLVYERAVKPGENITIDASWAIVVVSKDRLNLYPLLMPNDTTTVKTVAIGEKVWSDEDKAYTFISMPEALIGQQYLYGSILSGVDVTAGRDGYFYVITHPRTDSNFAASVDNYNFKRLELPEWTFADYTVKRNTWVYELRVSRGERIQLAPWWGVLIGSETQLDLTGNGITVPGSQLAVIESDSYASVPVALKQQVFSDQTPYYYHTIPYWMAGKNFLCAPLNGGSATVTKAGKLYLIGRNQANGQQYLDKGFTHVMDLDFEPWGGAGLGGGNFAALGFALYQKDVTVGETVTWGRWGVPLFYSDAKLPAEPITGLQSLSIDQMPTKTTYKLGESFDATGLVVTGIDRNGQKIIIDSEHYLLAPAVLSADVPAVSVIVDDKICAIPVTVTDENGKDLTDYSPADMSGFTTQKAPIITGSISLSTVDSIVSTIKKEEADGATGFIVYLTTLAESERTVENLKQIADCTQYPVMALAYGNYDNLEMRLNLWRMAVQAGFDAVDIPMDTYSVSYDACKESYQDTVFASAAPKEVSMDAEVIAQQKAFMAELRAMNPDVEILMSAHVGVAMNQAQGVALAKEMESRGADIAKIVLASSSDLEEALQTNMVLQEELNVPFFYNCAGAASRPYRTAAGLMGTQVVFCCAPYHEINAYVYDYAKDLRAFYNTIPELYQEPKGEENAEGVSLSTDYFLKTEDGKYTLSTAVYTDAMVDSVKLDGAVVNAASYRVKGSLSLTAANTWGQARILATADDHNGYVIALEKVGENAYQIFTMSRLNESTWNDWRLISHFEVNGNRNSIDFELVVDGSKITFLLDDQICYKNSRAVMTTSTPQFGASNVATATVSGLAVQVFADSAEAQAYLATKEQAAYVSRFQTRMDALYNEYIVENNCTNKGGTLIMGDSYMDFWSTWETQTGLTKYEDGYNVGIGGSAVKDWLLAYEQLVKPFAAERIILNIGYNDINVWGDNGEEFTQNLKTLFETIHADFPETEIYYIYINPSPSVYANGAYTNWKVEEAINRSKELVAGLDYVTGVDIFDLMTTEDGKNPVAAYYVSDNIHLSAAGYSVLSNHLRQVVFGMEDDQSVSLSTVYFTKNENGEYMLSTNGYTEDMVDDVRIDGTAIRAENYRVKGTLSLTNANTWGQAKILVTSNETNQYVIALEKVGDNAYQIFSMSLLNETVWNDWRLVRHSVVNGNRNTIGFELVVQSGKITFLVDDQICYESSRVAMTASTPGFGASNVATATVGGLDAQVFADSAEAESYLATKSQAEFVSPHKARMDSLYNEYIVEHGCAGKGGTLIFGDSNMDFWSTWEQDTGLVKYENGYNLGIGGSAIVDWFHAYDRMIKPFAADRFIMLAGDNDVNVWGSDGESAVEKLKALFEKIHADHPDAEIYYIYTTPSPYAYENGAYKNPKLAALVSEAKKLCESLDYVQGIDMLDVMTTEDKLNGNEALFADDKLHMNVAGYAVFSNYLRQVIFGLEPVEGYHFGNAEGYVTTGGIDLSNDTEENGTVSVNGGGTQYGYLKNSFADKLYVEAEFQVSQILNNDAWPKFGLMLNGKTEMVSFYVDMTTNLTSQAVGIVHCPTGGSYDWGNSVQTAVSGMAFTGENKVKLAVVRDGSDVYFYVNNVLVMKKIGELATENTVAGIFTFNTQLTVSNYILKTGDAAADAIAKAKADCAFFGTANGMQTSQGVDLSKDHGEHVGVATVNSAGDQTLYVKNHYEQTFYFETNVHVDAILAENTAPMVGLQAQNDTKAVRFYLSLAADKSVSGAGCMINGENAVTANVENVDLAEKGCYATLGMLKDGDKLHFFVNGSYVMTCQDTLAGNATAGAFSVDAGMELKDYSIILSGAKLNAMRALVPTDYIVSLNSNGTIQTAAEGSVIWSDKDYLFVSLPDALKGTSFVQGPIGEGVDVNVTKEGYLYVITPQRGAVDTCAITLDNYNFERLDMEMWRFCDASNNSVWVYEKKVNPGDVYKLARWAVVFTSTQKLDLTASAVIPESNAELAILQSVDGYKAGNLAMDSLVFADRTYAFNNVPYYLAGKNYIVNNYTDKDQSAVAIREGYVYMYTNTSTFTATTTLQDQGFTVVDNNAVHLFTAGTFNNYGFSLLKKYVRAGEVITWNQWAIPVFSGDLDISGGMIEDDSQLAILESNDGYTVKALALNEQVFSDRTAYVFSVMPSWAVGKCYIYGKYADTDQSATATRAGYVYMLTNTGTIHVASDLISKGFTLVSDDAVHLFTGGAFHTRGYSLLKKYVAQGETISWGQWAIPIFCGDASATENTYVNIAKLQAAQTSKVSTLEPGVRLFNDRLYYLRYDLPEALNGKSYIYDTIAGGYATVVEGGKVYMMIPVRCTMYKDLVAQVEADGWTPSAYRIFRFSPGLEYACRLYEKVVTAGETIHYSKYNVLIFDAVEGEGGYEMPSLTTGANVLTAPQGANYSPSEQNWLGCPTLEITDQGRIWASWFTGGEWELSTGNFALVSYSDDGAQSWNHAAYAVEHPDKAVQVTKPEFWTDPDGRLWLFWVQHTGTGNFDGRMGVWASVCAEPDAATPVWSEPQRLSDGYLRSKPIVLQSGEWIYSAFDWMEPHKTAVYISTDKGATWTLRGKAECLDASTGKNNLDDPTLVEKLDGTLWLIIRTDDGPYESFSYDKGVTWTHAVKSSIQGPATRMTIDRLDSGNLLMVYHDAADRSRLTAYLSTDDGATWQYKLLLDERSGVTYPDTVQTSDGTIYVIYDRGRTNVKEILLTRFTEQDVISGEYTDSTWQKVLVNK